MNAQEREILEVEQRFWDAMKTKDAKVTEQLTDDDCIIVGAMGVDRIDAKTMGKMTLEGPWEIEKITFDSSTRQVRFVADDVAIIAYKVEERVVVDGTTVPLIANDSSVWVRRDGQWRCALHTESLSGDPYGRDRKAPA